MTIKLEVHPALDEYLSSLDRDEIHLLYKSIQTTGCIAPVVYWADDGHNWIVDGVNRWRYCEEKNIQYPTRRLAFDDLLAVKQWIYQHQAGRRNWSDGQKALAWEKLCREKADAQNSDRKPLSNNRDNGHLPLKEGAEKKAKAIGVSVATIERASAVASNAVPEIQQAVLQGKIPLTEAAKISQQQPQRQREIAKRGQKKATTPSPTATPKDELGKDLPSDLLTAFAARESLDQALTHLAAVSKLLNPLMGNPSENTRPAPGGEHLAPHRTKVMELVSDLRSIVKFAKPFAPCPKSHKAAKCELCGDAGWVTKTIFDAAGLK